MEYEVACELTNLTVKKAVDSSCEILVSVSRRTISGSFKPALANSCKADGMVAENSSVCMHQWLSVYLILVCGQV